MASENIKHIALDTLRDKDVQVDKIDVLMDTTNDTSISMVKVMVYMKSCMYNTEEVKKLLESKLGIESEIFLKDG